MSRKSRGGSTVTYFGCCLPKPLLQQLDTIRGDVNRSRYLQRLIEKNMNAMMQANPEFEALERLASLGTKGSLKPNG